MIVHIVPTVPPNFNGLADYCFKLSRNWPDATESWGFLTLQLPAGAKENWQQAHFTSFEPSQTSLKTALETLEIDTLILHYVNYAYHPKGAPTWLPAALAAWKKRHPQARLVVMFHELWATGAPWRSCFWVLPTAKAIVASLAQTSDRWVTSCQTYFDKIVAVGGASERGAMIPIATGIEPSVPTDFERVWPLARGEKLKIAVFGLAPTRNTALSMHGELLRTLCERNQVEKIRLMGQSPQNEKDTVKEKELCAGIGNAGLWSRHYDLSSSEISALLREQDLGIIKDKARFLTKSSVFAVLCSHGVLPVCTGKESHEETMDSPFLINISAEDTISSLENEDTVRLKKEAVRLLATSSLNWSSVAQAWLDHLQNRP